jgi:hypothetical protein
LRLAVTTKNMTEEKQRIAIAEFCGWTQISDWKAAGINGQHPTEPWTEVIPYYPSDKNAMQQAKEKLDIHERELFRRFLRFVVTEDSNNGDNAPEFATAEQEAKALLLSLGKWEDVKNE